MTYCSPAAIPKKRLVLAGLALLLFSGCAEEDVSLIPDDKDAAVGGSAGSGGAATGGNAGSGGSTTGGAAGQAGSGGASGEGGSAGSAGGGTGGVTSSLNPSIDSFDMVWECNNTSPDPITGSFVAKYDNTLGVSNAAAVVTKVRLVFKGGVHFEFALDGVQSGPVGAGQTAKVTHAKKPLTGIPSGFFSSPCPACTDTWQLWVRWDVGGQPREQLSPAQTISCKNQDGGA